MVLPHHVSPFRLSCIRTPSVLMESHASCPLLKFELIICTSTVKHTSCWTTLLVLFYFGNDILVLRILTVNVFGKIMVILCNVVQSDVSLWTRLQECGLLDLNVLAGRTADHIANRPYLEKHNNTTEDDGLIGFLKLATAVMKHGPPFKSSHKGRVSKRTWRKISIRAVKFLSTFFQTIFTVETE